MLQIIRITVDQSGSIVPDTIITIMVIAIIAMGAFVSGGVIKREKRAIDNLYFTVTVCVMIWMAAVIAANFTDSDNAVMLYVWDSATYIGAAFAPVFSLLIAIVFTQDLERLPKKYLLLLVIPLITNIIAWTNPLHHLLYRHFSVFSSEIVFGPYIIVSGAYSYIMTVASIVVMAIHAIRAKKRLIAQQTTLFCIGSLVPGIVSLLGTLQLADISIAATPLAFIVTVAFHGYAIYHFHMLDIRPIALKRMMDWLNDCYLVTDERGKILDCNMAFETVFGVYGMAKGKALDDCVKAEDIENKTVVYNLMTALNACRAGSDTISFEQSVFYRKQKLYYMVDLAPLVIEDVTEGYIAIFRDVTKLKEGMQRLHDSQTRLMEQERLASLGQMVGGLAHNLKTPIMSIAGSSAAIENLVDECMKSVGDPEVDCDDYREIYNEMREWLSKMRDACVYMSDIITAVKGQATNITNIDVGSFSPEELMKRVTLLLRHELQRAGCRIETVYCEDCGSLRVQGDINSMVQVILNLAGNSAEALLPKGGGVVTVRFVPVEDRLRITVEDNGIGIPPDIRDKLFRQMITNKGSRGTGLGIYISNTVVKAKFGGRMWADDNPGGGAIFGLEIPFDATPYEEGAIE